MESAYNNIVCPVCTLYLRPGITLQSHLASHPKQKVIEALIKASNTPSPNFEKLTNNLTQNDQTSFNQQTTNQPIQNSWHQPVNSVPTNHSFIYQQFMSSSSGMGSSHQPILNVNPIGQHFIAVPTVYNPQMFCPPYVFHQAQQQLQIVTANPQMVVPRQPIGLLNNEVTITPTVSVSNNVAIPSQIPKHVDSATSTEEEAEPRTDNQNQNETNNNNEIEVYPDIYADMTTHEELDNREVTATEEPIIEKLETQTDLNNVDNVNNVIDNEVIISKINENRGNEDDWQDSHSQSSYKSLGSNSQIQSEERDKYTNIELQGEQTYKLSFPTDSIQIDQVYSKEKSNSYTSEPNENSTSEIQIDQVYSLNEKVNDLQIDHVYNRSSESSIVEQNLSFKDVKTTLPSSQINVDQIYTLSKENILPSSSSIVENVTFLELDEMNFMIANELMSNDKTIISKVEDFECIKDGGNKILLKIGDNTQSGQEEQTLNIHADEHMPPRGELSESESNGANSDWGKIYNEQECSSGMSTSYDLLARESWEGSDGSDSEMPPLQSRNPQYLFSEQIDIKPIKKAINYDCETCGESFSCPKERRVHQSKEHSSNVETTKKIKVKLARKTNKPISIINIKEEHNFELFAKSEIIMENVQVRTDVNNLLTLPPDFKEIKQEILCPMCGELFSNSKDYNRHMMKTHKIGSQESKIIDNERYKCKTCFETFPSELKFTEHLRKHPLECNICGKNFYRKYNLHVHMKRHNNIRPHKCDVCGKAFITKQKLQEHTNIHTGNSPIKCTMCDETFRRHSNLVQHRNKHHFNIKKKYKDFVCHCGEVFHSKNKLNWHKEIHDSKPKSCTYCHEKFIHVSSLTRHIRRSHNQSYLPNGKKDTENVQCPICKGIYFKSSLEVHLQIHSGKRQFSCLICGKEFTTKWNLKLHKWTHASRTSKPFKCELCNGAFIRLNDYQAHMNSHKAVRPYTCNYCGCKFIRKYNCQRHVREHEEGKNYNCTVCNKSFHRSYYLKEHMRVHSGARPFACHICGKTSTTKSNHNKHMKIHHAREPVSTEG